MNYTTNYRIQKPFYTERYDVNIYNTNADIIDSALNKLELKNASQDDLLATKEQLNESNRNIENEIQRATAKENEILDKFDNIVIPTKISDLENDSNLGSITGIKGDNETKYHTEGNINITPQSIGALPSDGIAERALNDGNGNSISNTYAKKEFVGVNNIAGTTNIEIQYPIGNYGEMCNIEVGLPSLNDALKESTKKITEAVNKLSLASIKNTSVLNTYEEINENTDSNNIAGALALKESVDKLQQIINQLNSNLNNITANDIGALPTGKYYNGITTSINDILDIGISRMYIQQNSKDAEYLGYFGNCLIINNLCAGFLYQIIFCTSGAANIIWRRNSVQGDITLTHKTQLFKIKGEVVDC